MLTAIVGYWAMLSLNIPDFTRYARSQDSQIVRQAFGLPVAMTLYSFIGAMYSVWLEPLQRYIDWTRGCIAVTDPEIEKIWQHVPDVTPIEIRP